MVVVITLDGPYNVENLLGCPHFANLIGFADYKA